ncbi:Protein WTS-1 [Aphelenchoides avenae]|nr:Protein WTS-1 [Aphelenchus avenae]
MVDPDRYPPSGYVSYVDQLRRKVENVQLTPTRGDNGRSPLRNGESPATSASLTSAQPLPIPTSVRTVTATSARSGSSAVQRHNSTPEAHMHTSAPADRVVRCASPLPESVARRLRNNAYERAVKPCRAPMFRFFMEQHTERIIQQYRERNQRAMQLTKEMEAAELADSMKEQMLRLLRQKESKYIRLKRQKMNKNMFEMIRHIGVGAFGKVTLVRKKDAGQIYAMKTLSKEDVIQKQQAAHVKAERDILAEANSVWIVRLYFSFQDAQNLYFIMEYVPGGDMMQLLINKGIFSERLARFYMAELTCALEYVHGLGFIHRDIKPDNILIDKHGHIKLTDFGLCTGLRWTHDKRHYVIYAEDDPSAAAMHYREDSFSLPPNVANGKEHLKLLDYRHHKKRNQAHSVVGTGNYMAPEVILKTGHTQLCDWWSVGVICYEMVYGRPPFLSPNDNPAETQYMIVNWNRYLNLDNPMGARLSRDCVDFIASMCCDQTQRLGQKGAKDVKTHSWFSRIDFERLRSMKAEYIPRVEHAEDTSNFDTFEVNSDEFFRTEAPSQPGYNPAFFDFTFRNFFASEGGHQGPSGGRMPQRPSIAPLIASSMSPAPNPGPAASSTGSKPLQASSTTVNSSNAASAASSTNGSNVTNFSTTSAQYAQRSSQNAQRTSISSYKRYDNRMTQVEEDDGSNDEEYVAV